MTQELLLLITVAAYGTMAGAAVSIARSMRRIARSSARLARSMARLSEREQQR